MRVLHFLCLTYALGDQKRLFLLLIEVDHAQESKGLPCVQAIALMTLYIAQYPHLVARLEL